MGKSNLIVVISIALLITACGGGGDGGAGEEVFEGVGEASGDVGSGDGGATAAVEVGSVTQTADPGTGWVEVDGTRYDFEAAGSVHFRCEVSEDQIVINFQETTSGSDFLLQGGVINGNWNASLTFVPGEEDLISYGATVGVDPGTMGLDEQAFSYEGTLSRVEDYDIQNAEDVEGVVAVNCASPGGDPTAEVGGQSFTFPLSGAGSLECVVSDAEVRVLISHSQPEYLQLQIDIQDQGDELFGAVYVTSGDETYTSLVPPDGAGLTIDGAALSYSGVFATADGEEMDGSVSVTCG